MIKETSTFKKVNLFIIGVNKSGTSWLYHILKQHPQVCMSDIKELYYFGRVYPEKMDEYHSHFRFDHDYQYNGEATPTYYRNAGTAVQIKEYNPEARLLVIVRDPIKRFLSHFYYHKQLGIVAEDTNIQQFLAGDTGFLLSDSHYEHSLPSFWHIFGEEQLLIVSLEQAKTDPEAVWQKLTEFLKVNPVPLPLPRDRSENPTGSKWFRSIYRATIQPVKRRNYGLYETMLKNRALRWTKLLLLKLTGLAKKDELSPKIMSRLVEEFDPTYKYLK
jgi:hypothetical protein